MLSGRALVIAAGIFAVLWVAIDSGIVPREDPGGTTPALGILGIVFGISALVMHYGGQPRRVPLLVGTSLGTLGYCAWRLLAL
ncbi:MAG: hypothetical protein KIT14_10460 [bacterium]|nr:hypothetical protein [bacterium]